MELKTKTSGWPWVFNFEPHPFPFRFPLKYSCQGSFFLEDLRKPRQNGSGVWKERWLKRMDKESALRSSTNPPLQEGPQKEEPLESTPRLVRLGHVFSSELASTCVGPADVPPAVAEAARGGQAEAAAVLSLCLWLKGKALGGSSRVPLSDNPQDRLKLRGSPFGGNDQPLGLNLP